MDGWRNMAKTRLSAAQRAELAAQFYVQMPTVAAMILSSNSTYIGAVNCEEAAEWAAELIEACLDELDEV